MTSSTVAFGFNGLPHISKNYKGDKYLASRNKIKKVFGKLGKVVKVYVNMDTGCGQIVVENENNSDIFKIVKAICDSPTRMLKFSWESPVLEMKTESTWLQPYKTWLFLGVDGTYSDISEKCKEKLDFEQMVHVLEYKQFSENMHFESLQEEWMLEQEIDEILTNCSPYLEEYENVEPKKRKHDMIIDLDDDDHSDDSDDEYELVETFSPVSGKSNFSIEEICEHIRMLGVTQSKNVLSIQELTRYFGQKREYKRVSKRSVKTESLESEFPKCEIYHDVLHRYFGIEEKPSQTESLESEFPKLSL